MLNIFSRFHMHFPTTPEISILLSITELVNSAVSIAFT